MAVSVPRQELQLVSVQLWLKGICPLGWVSRGQSAQGKGSALSMIRPLFHGWAPAYLALMQTGQGPGKAGTRQGDLPVQEEGVTLLSLSPS